MRDPLSVRLGPRNSYVCSTNVPGNFLITKKVRLTSYKGTGDILNFVLKPFSVSEFADLKNINMSIYKKNLHEIDIVPLTGRGGGVSP